LHNKDLHRPDISRNVRAGSNPKKTAAYAYFTVEVYTKPRLVSKFFSVILNIYKTLRHLTAFDGTCQQQGLSLQQAKAKMRETTSQYC
jgi:hypothetical protein